MDIQWLNNIKNDYADRLENNIMPFWENHSIDRRFGGYLHCLERDGSVMHEDKGVWILGRECWAFALMYNEFKKDEKYLEFSKCGYDFIRKHCFDSQGRMYYTVTRDGRPLRMRRYFYSEVFAINAFAEYGKAAGDDEACELSFKLFQTLRGYAANPNPAMFPPKVNPKTRQLMGMADPMCFLSLAQLFRERDPDNEAEYNQIIDESLEKFFKFFYKPELEALLETVHPDGSIFDTPDGRTINPGHAFQCAWFLLQEGAYKKDKVLIDRALSIVDWTFKRGYDESFGGIFNFTDLDGKPTDKIEYAMKYWWPQIEGLNATLTAYTMTDDERYKKMYEKIRDFAFYNFADPIYGGWFGYLHRDGSLCLTLKGNLFKGPFHLPRHLINSIKLIESVSNSSGKG